MDLECVMYHPEEVLKRMVSLLDPQVLESGLELKLEIEDGLPCGLNCPPHLVSTDLGCPQLRSPLAPASGGRSDIVSA